MPEITDAFTQRFFNSRNVTDLLVTFAKQRIDNMVDEWRPNRKEEFQLTREKSDQRKT